MDEIMRLVQEAVSQAKGLTVALQNAVNYAGNITKDAEAKLKEVTDKEAKLEAEKMAVDLRAEKIAKVENIVKIEADGQVALKENGILLDRLDQERSALRKEATEKLREISAREVKVIDDNKSLDKGWESLRAKEASYKAEIEEKIKANFK